MDRFEIEDIVAQDSNGITFQARDTATGLTVAIRRFFLFGKEGGGLEKEEAAAFEIASQRLAAVQHVSLRAVLSGSVDPIDGMPYLVTEWIDGVSLKEALADQPLDPALAIDVLRLALEVSIVLSHILKEEAVWVETTVESILVGNKESGRGFTFWISPFKWLGSHPQQRRLSSIVALGEELTGWKGKLVSDQAGNGLGGWLKWLRNNPDVSLREALESLAASTGHEPPPPEQALIEKAVRPQRTKIKQPSSKGPLLVTGAVALLVLGASLVYLHKTASVPQLDAGYTEQEISPVVERQTVTAPPPAPSVPPPPTASRRKPPAEPVSIPEGEAAAQKVNARAEELARQAATASEEADAKASEALAALESKGGILGPEDALLTGSLKRGDPLSVRGTLRELRLSGAGNSLYLVLAEAGGDTALNGVIHKASYSGPFGEEHLADLVGKTVTISGEFFTEFGKRRFVKINSPESIQAGE